MTDGTPDGLDEAMDGLFGPDDGDAEKKPAPEKPAPEKPAPGKPLHATQAASPGATALPDMPRGEASPPAKAPSASSSSEKRTAIPASAEPPLAAELTDTGKQRWMELRGRDEPPGYRPKLSPRPGSEEAAIEPSGRKSMWTDVEADVAAWLDGEDTLAKPGTKRTPRPAAKDPDTAAWIDGEKSAAESKEGPSTGRLDPNRTISPEELDELEAALARAKEKPASPAPAAPFDPKETRKDATGRFDPKETRKDATGRFDPNETRNDAVAKFDPNATRPDALGGAKAPFDPRKTSPLAAEPDASAYVEERPAVTESRRVTETKIPTESRHVTDSRPIGDSRRLTDSRSVTDSRRVTDSRHSPNDSRLDLNPGDSRLPGELPPAKLLPPPLLRGSGSNAALPEERPSTERTAPFFERASNTPRQATPRRAGAALAIGLGRLRYLELQPAGDRLIAMRFESVPLERSQGDQTSRERAIVLGLSALHKRLGGRIAPCTVLLHGAKASARVLPLQGATATRYAPRTPTKVEDKGKEPDITDRRSVAKIRAGGATFKTVLVTTARRGDVEDVSRVLKGVGVPVARVSTGELSFLQSVIPFAGRTDEDAAEAFVYAEPRTLTVCFTARGAPLVSQSFPLPQGLTSDSLDFTREVSSCVAKAASTYDYHYRSGEISRVRLLCGLPGEEALDAVAARLATRLGRPVEILTVDPILNIDPDSVTTLGIPADAMASLAAGAFEATTGLEGADLLSAAPSRAVEAGWVATLVAAVVFVLVALGTSERLPASLTAAREKVRTLEGKQAARRAKLIAERTELERLRAAQVQVERDRAIAAAFAPSSSDLDVTAVLGDLARSKPDDLYVRRVRLVRGEGKRPWSLEISATAVGGGATKPETTAADFGDRLTKLPRFDGVQTRIGPAPDTFDVAIETKAQVRP